jgi:hypothetical protein
MIKRTYPANSLSAIFSNWSIICRIPRGSVCSSISAIAPTFDLRCVNGSEMKRKQNDTFGKCFNLPCYSLFLFYTSRIRVLIIAFIFQLSFFFYKIFTAFHYICICITVSLILIDRGAKQ